MKLSKILSLFIASASAVKTLINRIAPIAATSAINKLNILFSCWNRYSNVGVSFG